MYFPQYKGNRSYVSLVLDAVLLYTVLDGVLLYTDKSIIPILGFWEESLLS